MKFEDKEIIVKIVNTAVSKAAFSYAKLGKSEKSVLCLENGTSRLLHSLVLPDKKIYKLLVDNKDNNLAKKYNDILTRFKKSKEESFSIIQRELISIIWEIETKYAESFFLRKNIKNSDLLGFSPSRTLIYISPTIKGCLIGIVQGGKVSTIFIDSLSTIKIIEHVIGRCLDKKESLDEIDIDGYFSSYINWQTSSFEKTVDWVNAENKWQDKLIDLSEWLWKELFEKFIHIVNNEKVVLLPYGSFSFLPLHISKYSNNKYIINKFNISYLPCIGFHDKESGFINHQSPKHMITNDFNYLESLTFINFEKEILKKYFPSASIIRSIPELSSKLSKSNIVHLSGHGKTDLHDPLSSSIDIFDNERLRISDCFDIDFSNTELMVLSACETGLRGFGADGEALSFSTALIRCGVSRVIGSMWVVRDDIATLQMVYFYYIYRESEITAIEAFWQSQKWLVETTNEEKIMFINKIEATSENSREAKLELISRLNEDKSLDFSHPFNWAGFYFTGM